MLCMYMIYDVLPSSIDKFLSRVLAAVVNEMYIYIYDARIISILEASNVIP